MKVYKGPDHPHEAQKPEVLSLDKYPNTKLAELQKRLEEEKSLAAKWAMNGTTHVTNLREMQIWRATRKEKEYWTIWIQFVNRM